MAGKARVLSDKVQITNIQGFARQTRIYSERSIIQRVVISLLHSPSVLCLWSRELHIGRPVDQSSSLKGFLTYSTSLSLSSS